MNVNMKGIAVPRAASWRAIRTAGQRCLDGF
jgi:hypothetical protein